MNHGGGSFFGLYAGITWHIGVRLLTSGHPRNRRSEESLSSIRLYSSDFPLKPRKPPSTGKTATGSKLDAARQVWPVDGLRRDPPSSAQRTTAGAKDRGTATYEKPASGPHRCYNLLQATGMSANFGIAGIDFEGLASSHGVVPRITKSSANPKLA
jgi:hypothetical protein